MRLDDFDPNAINVEDQRGSGFSIGGAGGKLGCGSIVIALIAYFVFGADPMATLGGLEQGQTSGPVATRGGTDVTSSCTLDQFSKESCNALSSLNNAWSQVFKASNVEFTPRTLVFYSQMGQ